MADHPKHSWIRMIDPIDASTELRRAYDEVRDPENGQLDAIMQVHGLHPAGLRAHYELYRAVMRPSPGLRGAEREMIALVVSALNDCHY